MEIPSGTTAVQRWLALPTSVQREVFALAEDGRPYPDARVAAVAVAWARQGLRRHDRGMTRVMIATALGIVLLTLTDSLVAVAAAMAGFVGSLVWYSRSRGAWVDGPGAKRVESANLTALLLAEPAPPPATTRIPARRWLLSWALPDIGGVGIIVLALFRTGLSYPAIVAGLYLVGRLFAIGLAVAGPAPPVRIDGTGLRFRRPRRRYHWLRISHVTLEHGTPGQPAQIGVVWVCTDGHRLKVDADDIAVPPEVAVLATMSQGVPFRAPPPPDVDQPDPVRTRPDQG